MIAQTEQQFPPFQKPKRGAYRTKPPEKLAEQARNKARKRILLAIDPDLYKQVEEKAGFAGMNVTELITHMLKKYLPEMK